MKSKSEEWTVGPTRCTSGRGVNDNSKLSGCAILFVNCVHRKIEYVFCFVESGHWYYFSVFHVEVFSIYYRQIREFIFGMECAFQRSEATHTLTTRFTKGFALWFLCLWVSWKCCTTERSSSVRVTSSSEEVDIIMVSGDLGVGGNYPTKFYFKGCWSISGPERRLDRQVQGSRYETSLNRDVRGL